MKRYYFSFVIIFIVFILFGCSENKSAVDVVNKGHNSEIEEKLSEYISENNEVVDQTGKVYSIKVVQPDKNEIYSILEVDIDENKEYTMTIIDPETKEKDKRLSSLEKDFGK